MDETPKAPVPPPMPSAGQAPPPPMGPPPSALPYATPYPPGYVAPRPENPTAKRLVNTRQAVVAGIICGFGLLCAIAGAIVGQVGRAMQGRVV